MMGVKSFLEPKKIQNLRKNAVLVRYKDRKNQSFSEKATIPVSNVKREGVVRYICRSNVPHRLSKRCSIEVTLMERGINRSVFLRPVRKKNDFQCRLP